MAQRWRPGRVHGVAVFAGLTCARSDDIHQQRLGMWRLRIAVIQLHLSTVSFGDRWRRRSGRRSTWLLGQRRDAGRRQARYHDDRIENVSRLLPGQSCVILARRRRRPRCGSDGRLCRYVRIDGVVVVVVVGRQGSDLGVEAASTLCAVYFMQMRPKNCAQMLNECCGVNKTARGLLE